MRHLGCASLLSLVIVAQGCSDGPCTGNFAQLSADCPQSFDGSPASFPACQPQLAYTYQSRLCGDDLIGFYKVSTSGVGCFYDASSHQLVGARAGSDIPEFCGQSSNTISAGRVPDSCTSEPIATKDCVSQP